MGGSARGPAIIAKRSETEILDAVGDEAGFLQHLVTLDGKPLTFQLYQLHFLTNPAPLRWVNKARQTGFSFVIAHEAFARCMLRRDHTAHIVSYSQAEAKEKIRIARRAYESLPLPFQKKLVIDSKTELGFEGPTGGLSRILAHPSNGPRGYSGDIYLDELAHYVDDEKVYKSSTSVIVHGTNAQLTGCSTPMGRRGTFWEIAEQELHSYPLHHRQRVPWWLATFFCTDVAAAAAAVAKERSPSTTNLVERFGTARLRLQFDSLTLDDFEQEFCLSFADTSVAYFPYDLVLPCTQEITLADDVTDLPRPEGRYVAGYDVGRVKDRSALAVFDEHEGAFTCKMLKIIEREAELKFNAQEDELRRLLDSVPIARLSIDRTGMGMQLTESLQRDFPNVQGEVFTNDSKERWVTNVKILLQQKKLVLPSDRDLVADFHSITRKVSATNRAIYDAKRTARGHADAFWAVALAVQREMSPADRGGIVTCRIIGGREGPERGSLAWLRSMCPDGPQGDGDLEPAPMYTRPPVTAVEAAAGPVLRGRDPA